MTAQLFHRLIPRWTTFCLIHSGSATHPLPPSRYTPPSRKKPAATKQMPTTTAQEPTTLASPTYNPSSNQAPMSQLATCQPLPSHASRPVPIHFFGK
ncbi:hypothetical protein DSO57_1030076 [Entomophthora muscae]|uniref:Uncharacterized protein n=1 Tax=Entomophthora muscae TaxID=34485 RepID=A0ACC2RS41_9FUNG|nr:hypothetical protein DSO57_1030076 [Entomophthora muscae]